MNLVSVFEAWIRAMQGRTRFVYSSVLIEGRNVPLFPQILAAYYPLAPAGTPRYCLITTTGADVSAEALDCRRRILAARVPPHILKLEGDLVAHYNAIGATEQGRLIGSLAIEAQWEQLPLFIVMFGETRDTAEPVLVAYYPPGIPLIACLEILQGAVRDAEVDNPL